MRGSLRVTRSASWQFSMKERPFDRVTNAFSMFVVRFSSAVKIGLMAVMEKDLLCFGPQAEEEDMDGTKIVTIDETIREGMQHSGIVFSYFQRQRILDFQEKLGVDICQAGYPSAHITEADNVKKLFLYAVNKGYKIQVAGMGRAFINDAEILIKTGINHFHLHAHIHADHDKGRSEALSCITKAVEYIRSKKKEAEISLAILDIGRTDPFILEELSSFFIDRLKTDILSLPDTSGIMSPDSVYDGIYPIAIRAVESETKISIHCHNDMGMASANTIMGIKAGGKILEASVLGIGERNGIADIFITGKMLKDNGFEMNLKTDKIEIFREYYEYVNGICRAQTRENLLNVNTPFFGDAVKTHVAGTHGAEAFGIEVKEKFFLNLLCGKHLVKKYLKSAGIGYDQEKIGAITARIKSESAKLKRRLTYKEIKLIAEQA